MNLAGWQKRSDGKVTEEAKMLEPKQLHEKYLKVKKPVKFPKALQDAQVLKSWAKDENLKEK